MVVVEPSQFITDYRGFAIITTVLFAILGPLSLITGVPAVVAAFRVSCHERFTLPHCPQAHFLLPVMHLSM